MKKSLLVPLLVAAAVAAGCSRLSPEAKEIAGTYYNPELSQTDPVMELRPDATCLIRAIKPGVLTFSVEGRWNVVNDSLVMTLEPSTLVSEGDSTLIGTVPSRIARKVAEHNDFNLQLDHDGVVYLYQRR